MNQLIDRFYQIAKKYANKKAIWCDGEEMTYRELSSLVCKYANYLTSHGVEYRDIIGVPMNNSIESVALILASAAIGAGLAPVNPTIPADAIDAAFRSGNVKHVIARHAFFKSMENADFSYLTGCKLCLDDIEGDMDSFKDVLKASDEYPDMSKIQGTETLILTMTSGSTGNPKPIELTQENKLKRINAHVKLYGITEKDKILAATPLYHSLAERLVLLPLLVGGTSILLPRFTPVLWLNCVKEQQVTFTIAVSAQLSQIAQLLSSPFVPEISCLRTVVSSSALLEPHVRNELIQRLHCDFHEMYGTSECSTVTNINFRESSNKIQSVGKPLSDVNIKILDDNFSELKVNEIGEIAVQTPLICAGYYNMPDKMKEAMYGNYFLTGDLGRLDEDGYLYYSGRKKEIIITGGVNVYPQDIENKVMSLDDVQECAAFPYNDERLGEIVALAIVLKEGSKVTKKSIRVFCAKNLADFQQPHKIFFLEKLPKNSMGKLVKLNLPEAVAGMEG
jgi:acyl-CoA synthetase (AMP-forming)/AMP-acid ligase II